MFTRTIFTVNYALFTFVKIHINPMKGFNPEQLYDAFLVFIRQFGVNLQHKLR